MAEERGGVFSQDEQDALFREAEANFEAAQQTGEGVGNYLEEKLAEQIRYALERRGDEGAAGGDYINHVTQELLECRVIGTEEEWRVIEAEDEALILNLATLVKPEWIRGQVADSETAAFSEKANKVAVQKYNS